MPERRLELPLKGLAESRRTLNPGSVGVVCATSIDAALPLLFGCRLREGKRPPILFVRRETGKGRRFGISSVSTRPTFRKASPGRCAASTGFAFLTTSGR